MRMNCQKTQGKVLQNVHPQEEFKSTVHTKALQLEKGVSGGWVEIKATVVGERVPRDVG